MEGGVPGRRLTNRRTFVTRFSPPIFLGKKMFQKFVVAALSASTCLVAAAQSSVTIYGLVDIGIATEDVGAPGSKSKTSLAGGTQGQSRLGFRGTEDLGGGLKALFNIETGYKLDTGESGSPTVFFARRAVAGFEGSFGQLLFGREYTPIAQVAGATDPMGHGFYGTDLNSFDDNGNNRVIRRASNTVNYKTPSFGGLFGRLAYRFGEQTTSPKLGDLMALSVEYSKGPMYLGGGYTEVERVAAGNDKQYILGAAYKFGDFHLKANYLAADPTGPNNKYEQVNLGLSKGLGGGRLYTNVQQSKDETGAKANGFGVTYSYNLSKRTNLFTSYGTLRNNELGRFTLSSATAKLTPTATQLGADPTGFVVGMRHLF